MATEFESLSILLLQVLVLICALQVVLGAVIVYYLTRVTELVRGTTTPRREILPSRPSPAREPAPSPAPVPMQEPARELRRNPRQAWAVEILEGRRDIRGSIQAVVEKYGLRDLILTTPDGLVVVALSPGIAEEAARLSGAYRKGRGVPEKDVVFLPMVHRGEELLAILRTDHPPDGATTRAIEKDVAQILNWWL